MSATVAADFAFVPKVWGDMVNAYFDKQLVWGRLAVPDRTLQSAPGTTINMPFFKAIGAAEEPTETGLLTVDKLSDDAYSATVKEVGKAVGFKDKSLMVSSQRKEAIFGEAQSQIGRVLAEKVDADLVAEINTLGNYQQAFTSANAADLPTIQKILKAKITAFGDKQAQVVAMAMHSQTYMNTMIDQTNGFLKADANDPLWGMGGFVGRFLGMAVIVSDTCPEGPTIAAKKSYQMFMFKQNPYGYIVKQDPIMEKDRDILARESVVTATQWYAVKAAHAKINPLDYRIGRATFVSEIDA